eukprot:TRINITY_DN9612_c0_g1_i7.p1 TRINITY_DN9612_c0_g1~~TRINITY_DN9612_c0_g1_i7.p1  ORF type:complete len:399 (-),score=30.12 TRINITY_DN9612_c0_g1_i7:207-1403(-)
MAADSQLEVNIEDLYDLDLDEEQDELTLDQICQMIVRSFVVLSVIIGSIIVIIYTKRKKPGIWTLVFFITLIQLLWQLLAWYHSSVDAHFVKFLKCAQVDCLHRSKIYKFCENLFHGLAVYTGVVLVAKLEGLTGFLVWILYAMCGLAPLIYSLVILLLDFSLTLQERSDVPVNIGLAIFAGIWLNLIPAGLLVSWAFGKLLSGYTQVRTSSQRQTASHFIAILLVLFHLVHLSRSIVYVVALASEDTETQLILTSPLTWLQEAGHILAALAIPWALLLALLLPRRDSTADATEMNLKLAKQNKSRNIIKYRKESKSVDTPPQTPYKFQPEVTSSPSASSQANYTEKPQETDGTRSKRSSYIEAMSEGSFHELPTMNVNKSRSEDPLWLTPTHLEQRV